jgi:hypothetical protein
LRLAEQGHPIFPVVATRKVPLTSHGFEDATTDRDAVEAWWARWPAANIGLATGHTVDVLDVDVKHGAPGMASFRRLARVIPIAANRGNIVRTASGGMHVYFLPSGRGNGANAKLGLDYRGRGGYVIAPPSLVYNDDGSAGLYVLEQERAPSGICDWVAGIAALQPKPQRPVHATRPAGPGPSLGAEGLLRWLGQAVEGQRNDRLNRVVFQLARERRWDDATAYRVREIAADLGLDPVETTRTIDSALRGALL